MIGWMLYCIVVAAIVAVAARAAESLARVAGYRRRWIWLGALALAGYLSVSSAVHEVERPAAPAVAAPRDQAAAAAQPDATWMHLARSVFERVDEALDGPLVAAARAIDRIASSSTTKYAGLAWLIISLVLATIFTAVIARFQRARRHWPLSRLHDVPVRVSPSVGPIVIGVVRPEIVVPRWLLRRTTDEQRLAVAHEQEHLRARDPIVLSMGWLGVIAMPWNPAVWYMLSRLRLAIELDCDARVLRRGAPARAYGSLLIEVAQNASPLTLSALGLADESSQLYQRILALRKPAVAFARTRAIAGAVAAAAGLAIACRIAPPPTAPAAPAAPAARESLRATSPVEAGASAAPRRRARSSAVPPAATRDSVRPLLLIDGVRSSFDDLNRLDQKKIDKVEILKGAAAIDAYGADARRGVVTVTTKQPPPS
jgi:beta-lactamase regulating signal transducer with metallopeptidase domain